MPKYQFAYNVNRTGFIFCYLSETIILETRKKKKKHFLEKIVHWNLKVYRLLPGRNILFVYVQQRQQQRELFFIFPNWIQWKDTVYTEPGMWVQTTAVEVTSALSDS